MSLAYPCCYLTMIPPTSGPVYIYRTCNPRIPSFDLGDGPLVFVQMLSREQSPAAVKLSFPPSLPRKLTGPSLISCHPCTNQNAAKLMSSGEIGSSLSAPLSVSLPPPFTETLPRQDLPSAFRTWDVCEGRCSPEHLQTSHWTRPASMPLIALQPKPGGHLLRDVTKGKSYAALFPRLASCAGCSLGWDVQDRLGDRFVISISHRWMDGPASTPSKILQDLHASWRGELRASRSVRTPRYW